MLIKTRRNGGRLLVVAIESADNKGLTGLRDLLLTTVDNLKMRGFSTAKCPSDVLMALSGVGVKDRRVQFDDDGEEHVFVVCDCGDFDLKSPKLQESKPVTTGMVNQVHSSVVKQS